MWQLAGRLSGQLRVAPGAVLGWDLGAALAVARTMGVEHAAGELLPVIEEEMVRAMRQRQEKSEDD